MSIIELLSKIRGEQTASITMQQKTLQVLLSFSFGVLLGFISKYSDTIPSNGLLGYILGIISDITTRLGIWVLLATIIAVWSNNPRIGAIKVFAFFVGMLLMYYIYSMWLFGFFPTYYFIHWGVIALASPIAAYIVWFSRGNGWIAAFCAAMPIGLLVSTGYPFFYTYTFAITHGFEILFSVILFIILPTNQKQRLRIFTSTLFIMFIIRNSNILSYLFGGL
ncbi:hypothetical protein ACH33_17330 [Aneurinibacillus sp. XH2]|uniref:hypothetical protein n=1 Tax=Aneurinibacillus sp. XH2 TaxID=1450761 RepID=UPI00070C7C44|nr:hypothetical protein [Aneurinibacillus sp. XH2]AMA74383.1 hypothetical protein ACH33_17330 [Aneurinibacillus sp. XH2]